MLTAAQIEALRSQSEQLLDPLTDFLIEDIAKRVSKAGQFTATASYDAWKLQQLGVSQRKLKQEIAKRLEISLKDAEKLLTQAAKTGYNFDMSRFPTSQAIPLSANSSLQQILQATVEMAKDDLTNITQTIGFVGPDGQCHELTDAYNQACDFAFQKVSTGAQDYQSAIREATRNLAEKGIRTIDYESGVHTSIEAAVRRNIMGGLGIMQEKISQSTHDTLGCDGFEISAHTASAEDHAPFQGRQYSDEAYAKLNNSLVRRIGTLNCGHAAFPIILGVHEPVYSEEELEEFRKQNEEGVTFDGKHYTLYEATQRQRKFERTIRKQKRRILVDESTEDAEKLQIDQIKLQRLKQEYARFSKGVGLPMQHARMETAGFTWKHGKAAEKIARGSKKVGVQKGKEYVQLPKHAMRSADVSDETPVVTNTPVKPDVLFKGCVDLTQEWLDNATPNSHEIKNVSVFEQDGVVYRVDGTNVKFEPDEHEKEIAELLKTRLGGDIRLMPKVSGKYSGIQTPDYLFRGQRYDLKTMDSSTSKRAVYNALKSKQEQADNFILDITNNPLGRQEIIRQIKEDLFCTKSTRGTKVVILVENGDIIKIFRRK